MRVLQHLFDMASLGGLYALIALGIALVFGVMNLVNFAYGELLMVGGYTILLAQSLPWPVVALVAIAAAVATSLAMERIAFRPVRAADPTTMLITSFAVSILLQNVVVWIAGRRPKGVQFGSSLADPVHIGSARVPQVELLTIALVVVLLAGLVLLLKRTQLGIQMRAAAEDFRMTRLMGVKADTIIVTAFAASGALAAVAVLLLIVTSGTVSPGMGLQPVLVGFVATVIGGMGSLVGAAVGGFMLGSVTVLLQWALPLSARGYRDALVYTAVILVLLLRPRGLFASRAMEERV
jgi:branched-chain amino acid transport system permease protein